MTKIRKNPTEIVDFMTAADMADVQRMVLEKAKAGSVPAAAIAERVWRRRRRPVHIDLPPVNDASGVAAAQAAVIAATARGEMTPQEGAAFANLIEARRRALELVEYEARLSEIERDNEERARLEKEAAR